MTNTRYKKYRSWAQKIRAFFYLLYLRVLRIRAEPHEIALGLALGIFVGCLPIIPFQTIVVIPLAIIFRANKLASFLATFISNPIDMIPFYILLWYIGSFIFPADGIVLDMAHLSMKEILHQGTGLFIRMCIGGLVLGIPSSIATYFITHPLLCKYKKRRLENRLKKAQEKAKARSISEGKQ